MRTGIAALAFIAGISSAIADDVTITVSDQWKPIMTNAQGFVDQCVAGGQIRGDYSKCKDLWTFLGTLANLPTTPVAKPAQTTPPQAGALTDAPKN